MKENHNWNMKMSSFNLCVTDKQGNEYTACWKPDGTLIELYNFDPKDPPEHIFEKLLEQAREKYISLVEDGWM